MSEAIMRLLDEVQDTHNVEFEPGVRTAIEARGWLLRLGLPFNHETLLRAILRDGFDEDSAFNGMGARLTPKPSNSVIPSGYTQEHLISLMRFASACIPPAKSPGISAEPSM